MAQMEKRKRVKGKGKIEENKEQDDGSQINDSYGGYGIDMFNKPRENKILDKTFLGELKVVEVKDSDDEEYF